MGGKLSSRPTTILAFTMAGAAGGLQARVLVRCNPASKAPSKNEGCGSGLHGKSTSNINKIRYRNRGWPYMEPMIVPLEPVLMTSSWAPANLSGALATIPKQPLAPTK